MIPLSLFPCAYTDGARVVAEISLALDLPLYTDQMVLDKICLATGRSQKRMKAALCYEGLIDDRSARERETYLNLIREHLAELCLASTSWFYFGTFSSLLNDEAVITFRTVVVASEDCRIKRAASHEKVSIEKAKRLVRNRDALAAAWTSYLFNTQPYDESLYDLVVTYSCQDLMDVIGWISVKYDEHSQKLALRKSTNSNGNPEVDTVRHLLASKGINAKVTEANDELLIALRGSRPFFSRLALSILEWTSDIRATKNIRVIRQENSIALSPLRYSFYTPYTSYELESATNPA